MRDPRLDGESPSSPAAAFWRRELTCGPVKEAERVLALDADADDYLVKPFGLAELQARIRPVLRRPGPASP